MAEAGRPPKAEGRTDPAEGKPLVQRRGTLTARRTGRYW